MEEKNDLDWGEISKRTVEFLKSKLKGSTQNKLGKIINEDQSNLSKVLRGERDVSETLINKLVASPLKADKNYLMYGTESDNLIDYESNANPYKAKYIVKLEEIDKLKDDKIELLNEKERLNKIIANLSLQVEQLKRTSRQQSGGNAGEKIAKAV